LIYFLVSVWLFSKALEVESLTLLVGLASAIATIMGVSVAQSWRPMMRVLDQINPPPKSSPKQSPPETNE
jgi:hypothetical protein